MAFEKEVMLGNFMAHSVRFSSVGLLACHDARTPGVDAAAAPLRKNQMAHGDEWRAAVDWFRSGSLFFRAERVSGANSERHVLSGLNREIVLSSRVD
jgi:hypothetical protein